MSPRMVPNLENPAMKNQTLGFSFEYGRMRISPNMEIKSMKNSVDLFKGPEILGPKMRKS